MQNYKNHLRLNPAHHFVLIPTTLGLFIWSVVCFFVSDAEFEEKLFWFLASFALVLVSMITRVYALKNQDRLIRLEMRQRYFELTGTSFNSKENQLKLSQIIALRFASDEELIELTEKAVAENLTRDQIKSLIKNWKSDTHRV
jgi:hypothetical protein